MALEKWAVQALMTKRSPFAADKKSMVERKIRGTADGRVSLALISRGDNKEQDHRNGDPVLEPLVSAPPNQWRQQEHDPGPGPVLANP